MEDMIIYSFGLFLKSMAVPAGLLVGFVILLYSAYFCLYVYFMVTGRKKAWKDVKRGIRLSRRNLIDINC
jgi:hypothetical protein